MKEFIKLRKTRQVREVKRDQSLANNGINSTDATNRRRPLTYWDDLRTQPEVSFETQENSAVFVVNDTAANTTLRLAHVVNLNPYSAGGEPIDLLFYVEASMFLALHHFNERNSTVLQHLPDLLGDCDLYFTMDVADTNLSPIVASKKALSYMTRIPGKIDEPLPVAFGGAARSAVSQPVSILSGVYSVPQVNGASTSSVLDSKDTSPTFVRTVPTNRLDAEAVIAYLSSVGIAHFGVLYVRDPYGNEFNRDLADIASRSNITVVSESYEDGNEASIVRAMQKLKQTQFRYIFAILTPAEIPHKIIIRKALDVGIIGNERYAWLFAEGSSPLLEQSFYQVTLNSSLQEDREIARALDGSGLVTFQIPLNERFDAALQALGDDNELYNYFVSLHDDPDVLKDLMWQPFPFNYCYTSYDAIMALGIGLCNMTEKFPVGPDIVEALKATSFLGSSGPVLFDPITGTRAASGLTVAVINLMINATEEAITAEMRRSADIFTVENRVDVLSPFLYNGGTTNAPLPLPPVENYNFNLIPIGARAFGWALAGTVIILSVGFAVWTYAMRQKVIVRVAQPIFLCLLCLGALLMASTIIPLSLQEPISQRGLDIACVTVPWLFVLGFSTAFASLQCKLLRLNKVFQLSAAMRRVKVKAKDVFKPFIVISVINFAILLSWTLVAPLQWSRVNVANFDLFGRSVESYGSCFSDTYDGSQEMAKRAFMITLGVFNLAAVLLANYQCYLSRHVPSDFNESYYITLSMASILEGFLIGIPILFFTGDFPAAFFVVASLLISFLSFSILLPTFGTKIASRFKNLEKADWKDAMKAYKGTCSANAGQASYDEIILSHRTAPSSRVDGGAGQQTSEGKSAEIRERAAQKKFAQGPCTSSVAEIRERVSRLASSELNSTTEGV